MADEKEQAAFEGTQAVGLAEGSISMVAEIPLQGKVSGGPMFGSVSVYLRADESVIADAGTLLWMDADLNMSTEIFGNCCQGCARTCAGESCCMNRYKSEQGGLVAFSFPLPGDLVPFAVTADYGWILNQGGFVAGTENLKISARFIGCCAACAPGLVGEDSMGEGLFMTKVTLKKEAEKTGLFYAGGYGAIHRNDIGESKVFYVDNGYFFAAKHTQKIRIAIVGGIKSACCGGERLVMKFTGPCTIFTQNRDPSIFKPPAEGQDQGSS